MTDTFLKEVEDFRRETRKSFNSINKFLTSLGSQIRAVRKREHTSGYCDGRKKNDRNWIKKNKEKREQKYPNTKQVLYEKQQGICNGCKNQLDIRYFHKDHIVPKSKGGKDIIKNLQLLCGPCNSLKGTGTMADLRKELKRKHIIGNKKHTNQVNKNTKTTLLKATYKGKEYQAILFTSGEAKYKGKTYPSLNKCTLSIVKSITINTKRFWNIQQPDGTWVRLNKLPRKPLKKAS